MSDRRIESSRPELHPSLQSARVPDRPRRSFSESVDPAPRQRAPGLVTLASELADNAGPVGSVVAAGLSALGGTDGGSGGDARGDEVARMWAMQRDNQAFNVEYLALQESIQNENRRFTTMSNLLKARHDTAKSAISNIRV